MTLKIVVAVFKQLKIVEIRTALLAPETVIFQN